MEAAVEGGWVGTGEGGGWGGGERANEGEGLILGLALHFLNGKTGDSSVGVGGREGQSHDGDNFSSPLGVLTWLVALVTVLEKDWPDPRLSMLGARSRSSSALQAGLSLQCSVWENII